MLGMEELLVKSMVGMEADVLALKEGREYSFDLVFTIFVLSQLISQAVRTSLNNKEFCKIIYLRYS